MLQKMCWPSGQFCIDVVPMRRDEQPASHARFNEKSGGMKDWGPIPMLLGLSNLRVPYLDGRNKQCCETGSVGRGANGNKSYLHTGYLLSYVPFVGGSSRRKKYGRRVTLLMFTAYVLLSPGVAEEADILLRCL